MKNRFFGRDDSGSTFRSHRSRARRIAGVSGRGRGVRDTDFIENLEARVLLAGDHPSMPMPWVPGVGTPITIQSMPGTKLDGRGVAGGNLQSASDDDMFRFTMPGAMGTSDFVSVLVDTLLGTDNTSPLNSTLDSYVEIYNSAGQLITSGANNGVISSTRPGVATDGWVGFIGQAGQDYYIRVRSEQGALAPGKTRTGTYTVRVDAAHQSIAIDTTFNPNPDKGLDVFGNGLAMDEVLFRQDEAIYRITVPNDQNFLSLATFGAIAEDFTMLDTHISIYDGQGNLIIADEQSGRLTNAFATIPSQPGATFFVRVRSDELAANRPSTGQFTLVVDMAALAIPLDPVTRVNATRLDAVLGPTMNTAGTGSRIFQFTPEGNGLAFVTVRGAPAPSLMLGALPDPAITVYNANGGLIVFNDDFAGSLDSQVEVVLMGGQTYFFLVEGFDRPNNGGFTINIEAHHTFGPTVPVDDHINDTPLNLLNYENATPIIFNDPFRYTDFDGNFVDASWKQLGVGRGRLHSAGDTDVFQFTPPLNMQDSYAGDDGNQGRALYVGGNYGTSFYNGSASGRHDLNLESIGIWDAGRFYHSGPAVAMPGSIVGDIFAFAEWDLDGSGPNVPFLVAGGEFGIVDDMGNVVPTNLAIRVFQAFNPLNPASPRWTWVPLAETNGPVFALTVGNVLPVDFQGIEAPELYIGGRFTTIAGQASSNIAGLFFTGAGIAFAPMGAGVTGMNSEVRALHVFDPPQPVDPDGDGPTPQPPDAPAGLYVGGRFTTAPGVANANNIARWGFNPTTAMPMPVAPSWQGLGRTAYNTGVLGVNAADTVLAISSIPVIPPGGDQAVNFLFVGGARGAAGGFLRSWNAAAPVNQAWSADLAYGGIGPVRAMQSWVLPESVGLGDDPFLLVAGGTDTAGFVQLSDGVAFVPLTAADSAVHSMHTFIDNEPGFVSGSSVLYIGGSFTEITTLAGDPLAVDRLAKLDFDNEGDWARIGAGAGVDELRQGAAPAALPTVFALHSFNDNIGGGVPVAGQPAVWDRMERRASRVHLRVVPTAESFISDITITIRDSNLNIVYGPNNTLSTTTNTAPAGAFDPARQDQGFLNVTPELGFVDQFTFTVWGGEVYYIVIGGPGTGRYTIELITDAMPPKDPNNGDGSYQDEISRIIETPDGTIPEASNNTNVVVLDPTRAARAPELSVNATGRTRTFLDPTNMQNPAAFHVRAYDRAPSGISRVVFNDLPILHRVDDTDIYKFRAPANGFAEIRLATFGIISGYQEIISIPGMDPVQIVRQKQFNSPLDGALRIFNNDFEQVVYNNDNYGVQGFVQGVVVDRQADGEFDPEGRFFRHRDPRVVIPVLAGESYFIQVESGQLNTWLRDPTLVDWRHAIGAYEVLVRTTPSLNGIDDHANNAFDSTPILIDTNTGNGFVNGEIRNVTTGVFQNPDDVDAFYYIAPNRGQTFVRVVPTGTNNSLQASVVVIDATTGNIVAQAAAGVGQTAQLSIFPEQGEQFIILVDGVGTSQGTYRLEIDGPGIVDDHASERDWRNATPLPLVPFFGTATATGVIENPNDQDLFRFTAENYETASVSVTSLDITLNPFVQVFEVSSDRGDSTMGNPVFLQISFNDNGPGGTNNSLATFATTPGRTYYILVSGVNPNLDRGRYQVQVQVAPTDDHPNFTDFQSQGLATTISLAFNPLTQVGTGNATGNIEKPSDDDMFRFTAPANGEVKVVIDTPASSLVPRVNLYDANGNLLGFGLPSGGMAMVTFTGIIQNQQYFIQVLPNDTMADATGTYTVGVITSPVDDHADEGEFAMATVITLNPTNGLGTRTGIIVPETDTDLFRFSTLAAGSTTIRVTTTGSSLAPRIRIFNSGFTQIFAVSGNGDIVQQVLNAGGAGETYYVLVERDIGSSGATAVGQYQISVQGQVSGGGGPGPSPIDDHADAGEWNAASLIAIDSITGRGNNTGVINFIGDTDLFRFTAGASGNASVQINVPMGGLVDGSVRIFNQSFTQIAFDALGIPGATAAVSFPAIGGQSYFVLVEPVGFATGSYDVRVDSQPLQFVQYYPEGFASRRVDEFVPLVNPNSFPVEFALYARYERGPNDDVPIWTGIIQPNSRSGVTVTTRKNFEGALVRRNEPYALELRSSAVIGATFSHYDFNVSVGENFTRDTSTKWTFANFNKNAAEFRDFLLFYNPASAQVANLKITLFYENGFTTSFEQSVDPMRRSGINFNNDGRAPQQGRFGVLVESDIPIVAAQSSYNLLNGGGDGLLGDSAGGSSVGVIAGVSTGGGVSGRIAFLNTGDQTATITITASYARVDLPDLTRVITVGAGSVASQTLAQLGLTNNEVAGIRYSSNVPVTVSVMQYQNGDGDSTQAATFAATQFLWGDAFNNPRRAGITYIEDISLYNPAGVAIDITITFLFNNGTTQATTVNVAAGKFAFVSIDQNPIILNLERTTPYSLRVTAASPFVGVFTRYDRFLNGGWSALGSPVGLTNPLNSIV